jgi:tetratricopeptide (TPR) repeat protein
MCPLITLNKSGIMKSTANTFFALLFGLLLVTSLDVTQAQSREDAILAFNEGLEKVQSGSRAEAIESFKKAIQISNSVGSEADDIRGRAQSQVPRLQLAIASDLYRERRFEEAIQSFQQAREYAQRFGESQIQRAAEGNIPIIYLVMGNNEYRGGNQEKALEYYNKSLEQNPNNPKPHYQKGLVFRAQDNIDEALNSFDRAIQLALQTGDDQTEREAEAAARDMLVFRSAKLIEAGQARRAIPLLERSLQYDSEHAAAYYRMAEAHNLMGNWDQAISAANESLRYEKGGRVDRAKIYFELGTAYKNKGNVQLACDNFAQAAFGSFRSAAEHQIEHELKCNGGTR